MHSESNTPARAPSCGATCRTVGLNCSAAAASIRSREALAAVANRTAAACPRLVPSSSYLSPYRYATVCGAPQGPILLSGEGDLGSQVERKTAARYETVCPCFACAVGGLGEDPLGIVHFI